MQNTSQEKPKSLDTWINEMTTVTSGVIDLFFFVVVRTMNHWLAWYTGTST